MNSLRSAINLINTCEIKDCQLINRFFKGDYKLRPTAPKYNSTWDVDRVLKKLKEWSPPERLDLETLTYKLVMLLALGSAFRVQSLSFIDRDNIKILTGGVEIRISKIVKTSRQGGNQPYAFFPFFEEPDLCVAKFLLFYINATKNLRGNINQLFISLKSPHKQVSSQTISRWLKLVMYKSGLEEKFKAHSTRYASTSKALAKGLDINTIKKAAGWSETSKVFNKFYNRPIFGSEKIFSNIVLS